MTTIELNFIQRLKLANLLSSQEGPLGRTAPFLRVLNLVRFSDAEGARITAVQLDDKMVRYDPPTADFGERSVEVETADAQALLDLMNSWGKFTTADHLWADPLVKALSKT